MPISGTQQAQSFQKNISKSLNKDYLLYLPKGYDEQQQKQWPFILFLHGAGERGMNLNLVKSQGLPKKLEKDHDFPFIVVSPQCSSDSPWYNDVLDEVLNEVVNQYHIDQDRIYVTGLSMGGFGTWSLAAEYPERFAAIAPICGGGDPTTACVIKHLPIWVFHGAKDYIVPLEYSKKMVEALKECEGNVRFTIYPNAEHDSWTETYANPELYDWFLKHTRTGANQLSS